jgi:hypothetical protein
MKVAWHEVPGKPTITVPSHRERYDLWLCGRCFPHGTPLSRCKPGQLFRPYPTGRILALGFSRHFVPGYLLTVPPGQLDSHN